MTPDILIVYATRHGFTEKCASLLKEKLSTRAELCELKKRRPDLSPYATFIIGGSIHAGSIQKSIRLFCSKYKDILLERKVGLFLSCMQEGEEAQKEFEDAYPDWLREHAQAKAIFGGAFNFERMNAIERFMIRKISGLSESVERFDASKIEAFVSEITAS